MSIRELRISPVKIWRQLNDEEDIVITSNGKPIAVLNPIYNNNLESTLDIIKRARALKAMEEIQLQSVKKGLDKLTDHKINEIIEKVRTERRQ
ncbi:MAG: type II toxin-antitoxin system prevent-host-death family antitoxin [Actinobacteria bacterium]|nr:type II toxin-antitoxin system prevent-host-death family antitoxin [Actinomycetota bacterium]